MTIDPFLTRTAHVAVLLRPIERYAFVGLLLSSAVDHNMLQAAQSDMKEAMQWAADANQLVSGRTPVSARNAVSYLAVLRRELSLALGAHASLIIDDIDRFLKEARL